jgi:hypothetical protein
MLTGRGKVMADTLRDRINKKTSASVLHKQLGLENIKRHSFENKISGLGFGRSSVLSGSVEDPRLNGGKPTLIPFLYEGRQVDPIEAADRAVDSGRVWPSFKTNEEATAASKKLSSRLGRKK